MDDEFEFETCDVCDGPLIELGSLGRNTVTRCQDCGLTATVRREVLL